MPDLCDNIDLYVPSGGEFPALSSTVACRRELVELTGRNIPETDSEGSADRWHELPGDVVFGSFPGDEEGNSSWQLRVNTELQQARLCLVGESDHLPVIVLGYLPGADALISFRRSFPLPRGVRDAELGTASSRSFASTKLLLHFSTLLEEKRVADMDLLMGEVDGMYVNDSGRGI